MKNNYGTISVAMIVFNVNPIYLHLKGRCIKLLYRISMLSSFGISYLLSLVILWRTLPTYWNIFEIVVWDWMIIGPAAACICLNIINHLAVIYFTIHGVSIQIYQINVADLALLMYLESYYT